MHEQGLFRKATDLFARVPVLKALFIEILASQGVSTILNVAYVTKLSSVIPDDKERAGWSGKVSSDSYFLCAVLLCIAAMSGIIIISHHLPTRPIVILFTALVLCHHQRGIWIPTVCGPAADDAID